MRAPLVVVLVLYIDVEVVRGQRPAGERAEQVNLG
jgi:hypothetical protein